MKATHLIAALGLLCVGGFAAAETGPDVSIAVSRNGAIETVEAPERLLDAILKAVRMSIKSDQQNPASEWDNVFTKPNWIHAQFSPAKRLAVNGGKAGDKTAVSEILILFPSSDAGRRWPSYILLKTDVGILSQAKWSACQMRDIAIAAAFDPRTEAYPFSTYCNEER